MKRRKTRGDADRRLRRAQPFHAARTSAVNSRGTAARRRSERAAKAVVRIRIGGGWQKSGAGWEPAHRPTRCPALLLERRELRVAAALFNRATVRVHAPQHQHLKRPHFFFFFRVDFGAGGIVTSPSFQAFSKTGRRSLWPRACSSNPRTSRTRLESNDALRF